MKLRSIMVSVCLFTFMHMFASGVAAQQTVARDKLPDPLGEWVDWVIEGHETRLCPLMSGNGESVCVFPGPVTLDLRRASGGSFSMEVTADQPDWLNLPGDSALWPFNVKVNGKPAVVIGRGGNPAIRLETGVSRISGEFVWSQMPEGMALSSEISGVNLRIDGEVVPFPKRDGNARLWLQKSAEENGEEENLDVSVLRKVADGVPLSIATRIVLRVSGRSREISLENVLIPGTVPVMVLSEIPAKVDDAGRMRLQIHAGTHTVQVVARGEGNVESLQVPKSSAPWPLEEFWVFEADEKLRQTALSGLSPVDPSRTTIPEEWRKFPAFVAPSGGALAIRTIRRGEPEPPPNRLSLARNIWLDLDGQGYTVRDILQGEINQGWRLDLRTGELGQVSIRSGGSAWQSQLITRNPSTGKSGVELRSAALGIIGDWRLEGATRSVPAVGWSEDVQSLSTTLHLPPGWELLTATGVDELPGSFWDRWDLFSFFFVLIVSLAIGRLTRWYWGALALVSLVLSYQEPDAPFIVWIAILLSLGLLKVLPAGYFRTGGNVVFWLCVICLGAVMAIFSVGQIREGLYPQVGTPNQYMSSGFEGMVDQVASSGDDYGMAGGEHVERNSSALESNIAQQVQALGYMEDKAAPTAGAPPPQEQQMADQEQVQQEAPSAPSLTLRKDDGGDVQERKMGRSAPGSWSKKEKANLAQDPKAVVQTGPGVPRWQWNTWQLNWSGPVDKDHNVELYLLSPGMNLLLSILRVLLLVALCLRLVYEGKNSEPPKDNPFSRISARAAAVMSSGATLLLLSLSSPVSAAEIPEQALRDELRERLLKPADCQPDCIETSTIDVKLKGEGPLTLTAEVHAGTVVSWPIPGPAANWSPSQIRIDGKPTAAARLMGDGFIHVRIPEGRHVVTLEGAMPTGPVLTLEIPRGSHLITQQVEGWKVEGVRGEGLLETSIQLVRVAVTSQGAEDKGTFDEGVYPPWLEITRSLDLGLPWLVETHVKRISPPGTPILVKVPLIAGESVTESSMQVENGHLIVSMGRNDTELSWTSTLAEQPALTLSSPQKVAWSEVWDVRCSAIWQCAFSGIAPVSSRANDGTESVQSARFRPWPGESVNVKLQRPDGVKGQSMTIESSRLRVSPGTRLLTAELTLAIRSSRGGAQKIAIPKNSTVQSVLVNGAEQPFRAKESEISVNLEPGRATVVINWQQNGGIVSRFKVPEVKIDGRVANATVICNMPSDRWLIAAGGVKWGPAVLFWGYLFVVLIAGFVLGRAKLSPLKSWQWVLLAFGLTQVEIPVAMIIVVWFFVLAKRGEMKIRNHVISNIVLLGLGIWTVIAAACLVGSVYQGLAVQPDMQVTGAGSSNGQLIWYTDHVNSILPTPWVVSVPLLIWKLIMLAWALWLAASTIGWARWTWRTYTADGLWKTETLPATDEKEKGNNP